jgi:hypothetical protein
MINDHLVDRAGSIYAKTAGDFNERMVAVVALVLNEALGKVNKDEWMKICDRSFLSPDYRMDREGVCELLAARKSRLTATSEAERLAATRAEERVTVSRR